MKLNQHEMKVLRFLFNRGIDSYFDDFLFFGFAPIARGTKLKRNEVRRACRSLTRKGLARFQRGLWNEDGGPAGSGYGATRAAKDVLS